MFAQQLVNGLMLGGAYALVAIGYTLVFGVLNLLHLAHGEVFMVGASSWRSPAFHLWSSWPARCSRPPRSVCSSSA